MNYKIAICDDEQNELSYLRSLTDKWLKSSGNTSDILCFDSGEAFLFDYDFNKNYDLLLLDIEMKEISGIDLARKLRDRNDNVQIIFITGYPDFMSEGYDVAALHYLMKPVSECKLCEVLDRAAANCRKQKRMILLKTSYENRRIDADSVIYAEAFAHSVNICTSDGDLEVKMSMTDAEKLLGDGFVRCHRSYIVSLRYISRITKTEVVLDNGKALPLSRNSYNAVNQAFISYYL